MQEAVVCRRPAKIALMHSSENDVVQVSMVPHSDVIRVFHTVTSFDCKYIFRPCDMADISDQCGPALVVIRFSSSTLRSNKTLLVVS